MGILNVTPDSFSDGGRYVDVAAAVERAHTMVNEGADSIDIGGESSGPNSTNVSLEEELRRVIPVVKEIAKKSWAPILSVDTYKAEVARQAIAAGAKMINDVTALRGDPEMPRVLAHQDVDVVLMYSKDPTARTTRTKKRYSDVVKTVATFLKARALFAQKSGIKKTRIILDPGMGAFVSALPKYSYEILARLGEFKKLGFPLLVGTSKKSFLPGTVAERLEPTLITHFIATQNGASILRVHDVAPHVRMLKTVQAL